MWLVKGSSTSVRTLGGLDGGGEEGEAVGELAHAKRLRARGREREI